MKDKFSTKPVDELKIYNNIMIKLLLVN